MTTKDLLQQSSTEDTIANYLFRGSKSRDLIKNLQQCLNDSGFGTELNWERFGADGYYGKSTINAVKAFANKNNIDSNGELMTDDLLSKIIDNNESEAAENLRKFLSTIKNTDTISVVLSRGSTHKSEIKALQNALYEIGFAAELNWEKYGADGGYGKSTVEAVLAFANKNGFDNNGETLTLEMLTKINSLSEVTPHLRVLNQISEANENIQKGSTKQNVKALQYLLHFLGFDTELNWEKYGADGLFGNSCLAAVAAFANRENILFENEKVSVEIINKIISFYDNNLGTAWKTIKQKQVITTDTTINDTSTHVEVIENGIKARFKKFKKGLFTGGNQTIPNFLKNHEDFLEAHGISDSAINMIRSVAENEGNLDAINTWDNAHLSFGMFQWTIGVSSDKGELPALLKKIKVGNTELFQKYFGLYGLDISSDTSNTYGNLVLNNQKVTTQKNQFRSAQWANIFWRAGQDAQIQAFEIDHAISRLQNFYWRKESRLNNLSLANYVTSEFGVALLLDNHVNRPAYVVRCIEEALAQTGLSNPENWTTEEENKLIQAYLNIRKTYGKYPMTDAHKRANVTLKYLNDRIISKERLSFQFNEVEARSTDNSVNQPLRFNQDEFEEIINNENFEA